jgi:hypothetical protein
LKRFMIRSRRRVGWWEFSARLLSPLLLAMLDKEADLRSRGSIGSELVRDHHARRRDGGFQELLQEPPRRRGVPSSLDQDVENEAILVDGAP